MAGTIVADIIQSDQSYASSINIASPLVVSNTISMSGSGGSISGNTKFVSGNVQIGDGSSVAQTNAYLKVRGPSNAIEWGHWNQNGYGSTIGIENFTGVPWIGFNTEHGTNNNTYRTRGISGTVIRSSHDGGLSISSVANSNADNQSLTTRFAIDGSGRVTKPYQPSFNAGFSTNITSAGYLTHDVDTGTTYGRHNIGSAYSTSTGRFTAPVSGVYQFSLIHNMTYLNSGNYIVLRRNGNDMAGLDFSGISTFNGNYWYGRALSCSVYLSQGDYIQPYLYGSAGGYTGETGTWGHFSGFLVG